MQQPASDIGKRLGGLQDALIDRIWAGLVLVAAMGVPLSLSRMSTTGWLGMYAVHVTLGLTTIGMFLLRHRIATHIKAAWTIVLFWIIGLLGLATLGLLGAGTWWLVTSALLISVLYSARAGIITIALVCLTVVICGIAFSLGTLELGFDANAYVRKPASWATLLIATVVLPLVVFSAIAELNRNSVALTLEIEDQRDQLERLALYDELSGLPRQVLALDRLQQALLLMARLGNKVAVLQLGVEGLRELRETHGAEFADAWLCEICKRWRSRVRASDTLARMGEYRFVVVLQGLPDASITEVIAEKLIDACETPFKHHGQALSLPCQVGIAISPNHGKQAGDMLLAAEHALEKAQRSDGPAICIAQTDVLPQSQDSSA